MSFKTLSDNYGGGLLRTVLAFFTLLLAAITSPWNLQAQNGPQQCVPALLNMYASQSSVAVGDEFDLFVDVTNTSNTIIYQFVVEIGSLHPQNNPQQFPNTSMLENFHIIDSHHPSGRVGIGNSVSELIDEMYVYESSINWYGYPELSQEWLHPGQTTTLRLRLRAVGATGTLSIPAQLFLQNQSYSDCDYSTATDVTITEGELPGPFLLQKTLLANDLHDCIRLGEEMIALWQIMNTSNEGRWIRFQDIVPGYLFDQMNNSFSRVVYLATPSGTLVFPDGFFAQPDGEFANIQSFPIYLPANTTLYFTNYFDVSGYATPSSLQSTLRVWEVDSDTYEPGMPPGNAASFTNIAIPVCTPILTKTAVGDYCNVTQGTQLTYRVDIDRIILGSRYAYTILEDLHPAVTSYLPTADPNFAGSLYEYYINQQRTLWSFETFQNANQVPLVFDGDNPLFHDKLQLVYRLNVDESSSTRPINEFFIRNGSTNLTGFGGGNKIVAGNDEPLYERKPGDFLRRTNTGASKLTTSSSFEQVLGRFNDALPVIGVSYELEQVCYTIDGYKFNDLNGNGIRDGGEPGVQSWMIIAQSSEGIFTAVTDENGYYRIEGLPAAVWQVREANQLGWVQSAPGGEGFYNVALGSQVKSARLDFGNWKFAQISGVKYHDLDGSGSRGDGEPGVEGVRIELRDLNGQVLTYTFTDGEGHYGFVQVPPGHYSVNEDRNTSMRQSQPGPAEGGFYYVVATSNGKYHNKDFGNYDPVSISGTVTRVAKVTDDQTVRDVSGLKVQLIRTGPDGSEAVAKVASEAIVLDVDGDGNFGVGGLQPGDWQAQLLFPEFWSAASDNPVEVVVASGNVAEISFDVIFDVLAAPELRLSSITGSVYRNTTADHLYQPGVDVKVQGHSVRLAGHSLRGAIVERTTTTGSEGVYRFVDLPAGEYVVNLADVADSLRRGWPWADSHRVVLGDDEHVGAAFNDMQVDLIDAELPWKSQMWTAIANLFTRIDDNGDARADRRNFFSGPAVLQRTSIPGAFPMRVAHTSLRMAGTDSLGRSIHANGLPGGSVATIPSATALGQWSQALDLVFVLEGTSWYGPTATNISSEPSIKPEASVGRWLSIYTSADFVAQAGNAPVIRDPYGTTVASVLSASYVFTPGFDFGLTPRRFDTSTGGGTGSGGGGIGTNDPDDHADVPTDFALGAAYPNPFNPSTVVPFELASAGHVQLAVYDVMGRRVSTLVNGVMSAGRHSLAWDASGLPSGVYMLRLTAGGKQFVSKVTLLK